MNKKYYNKTKKSAKLKHQVVDEKLDFNLTNKTDEQLENFDSTSTSSTTDSTDLSTYHDKEDGTLVNILEILWDTTEESESDEEEETELEYLQRKSLAEEISFCDNFKEIPDIENISKDVSVVEVVLEKTSTDDPKDRGRFVNPLTGLEISTRSKTYDSSSEVSQLAEEEHSISESQEVEISDILLPEDILFEDAHTNIYEKEEDKAQDLLETFLEKDFCTVKDVAEEIDWDAIVKQQEAKRIHQLTLEFLNDLVHKVVEMTKYVSPEMVLRKNLDKRKLILELIHKHRQHEIELKVAESLNQKLVEYFKRKKMFRPILPETAKSLSQEKEKYTKALKHLDKQLAREREITGSSLSISEQLRSELEKSEQKVHNEIQLFEDLVKRNLLRAAHPQSNDIIEQLLRRMTKLRNEVSDVRFQMITKQHSHALLLEKLRKFEDLGNGMTLKEYEHIQTENRALDKKLEERNVELKKLHLRSYSCLHLLAHFKEKQCILSDVIAKQRSVLSELIHERSSLRKYIYQMKVQRNHIRHELNELSIQGGILDKPALMYDYDQTVERLSIKRELVNRLRVTLEKIQEKLIRLEKRLTRDSHNFSIIK